MDRHRKNVDKTGSDKDGWASSSEGLVDCGLQKH